MGIGGVVYVCMVFDVNLFFIGVRFGSRWVLMLI